MAFLFFHPEWGYALLPGVYLTQLFWQAPRSWAITALGWLTSPIGWGLFAVFAAYQVTLGLLHEQTGNALIGIGVFSIVVSLLMALVLNPLKEIEYALRYLRARRLGGEGTAVGL